MDYQFVCETESCPFLNLLRGLIKKLYVLLPQFGLPFCKVQKSDACSTSSFTVSLWASNPLVPLTFTFSFPYPPLPSTPLLSPANCSQPFLLVFLEPFQHLFHTSTSPGTHPGWKPPFPKYFVSSNQCPFKPHSRQQSVLDKLKVPSCEVFRIDLKSKNTLVIESRQQLSGWM